MIYFLIIKFILVFSSAQLQLRSLLPRATLFSLIQLTILFLSSPTIIIIIPSTCPYLSSSNCHTLNSLSHTQKGPLAIISWECVPVCVIEHKQQCAAVEEVGAVVIWTATLSDDGAICSLPPPQKHKHILYAWLRTLCVSPRCGKFSAKWSDIYMNLKKPKWEVLCWS